MAEIDDLMRELLGAARPVVDPKIEAMVLNDLENVGDVFMAFDTALQAIASTGGTLPDKLIDRVKREVIVDGEDATENARLLATLELLAEPVESSVLNMPVRYDRVTDREEAAAALKRGRELGVIPSEDELENARDRARALFPRNSVDGE